MLEFKRAYGVFAPCGVGIVNKYYMARRDGTLKYNNIKNIELRKYIAERDKIVAYSGEFKDKYLGNEISKSLSKSIRRRESLFETYIKKFEILEGEFIECSYINETILANSEEIGIICLYRMDKSVTESDKKIVNIVASFFTRYLEE